MIKNFYDLKVWRDAHEIALIIYKETKFFPKEEQFGMSSQIRRAASSVTANIAEGFGRFHYKDKIRFYLQARGSAVELQDHIFLSKDLSYLSPKSARDLFVKITIVIKELNGLIKKTGQNSSN
jgi:four helix bundle protein